MKRISVICVSLVASFQAAAACPNVGRIADFNCDGEARIVILGDSVVFGIGDSVNDEQGGYVMRTQAKLPEATVINLGVPGLRTFELISNITDSFNGTGDLTIAEELIKADLVILDLGRNDRWLMGTPMQTLLRLKRARALITKDVKKSGAQEPIVVIAAMILPNRGSQGPWVKALDQLIVDSNTVSYPADLRFDKVSKRLLSSDQIHPTSKGYDSLAKVLTSYILKVYPIHVGQRRID